MLKIHHTSGRTVVFAISGRLDADNVNELCQVVDAEPSGGVLVLDLTDLVLADRDAVGVLRKYEARGACCAPQLSRIRPDVDGG